MAFADAAAHVILLGLGLLLLVTLGLWIASILKQPQVAILGVGAIEKKAWWAW